MKETKQTLAQRIVERESAKIAHNPPPIPPGLRQTPQMVTEKAIIAHLEQFIQGILTSNRFEGELLNFSQESTLKEIREIIENLRQNYEKKWRDLRK